MPMKNFRVVRDSASAGTPDEALAGAVVAIGNFDGVHRGHKAVIAAAQQRAAGAWAAGRGADLRAAPARLLPSRRAAVPPDRRDDQIAPARRHRARRRHRAHFRRGAGKPVRGGFRQAHPGRAFRREPERQSALTSISARTAPARRTFLSPEGKRHGFAVDIVPPLRGSRPPGFVAADPRGAGRRPARRSRGASRLSLVCLRHGDPRRQARPRTWLPDR